MKPNEMRPIASVLIASTWIGSVVFGWLHLWWWLVLPPILSLVFSVFLGMATQRAMNQLGVAGVKVWSTLIVPALQFAGMNALANIVIFGISWGLASLLPLAMPDVFSKTFFLLFSVFGLIGVATVGLYFLATKLRGTSWAWFLAILMGCVGAYATEFSAEIASLIALGRIPNQPWSVAFYAAVAVSTLFVSANATGSRWPVVVPSLLNAVLALQYGVRVDSASIYAGAITALVAVVCWFGIPGGLFKLESER